MINIRDLLTNARFQTIFKYNSTKKKNQMTLMFKITLTMQYHYYYTIYTLHVKYWKSLCKIVCKGFSAKSNDKVWHLAELCGFWTIAWFTYSTFPVGLTILPIASIHCWNIISVLKFINKNWRLNPSKETLLSTRIILNLRQKFCYTVLLSFWTRRNTEIRLNL